MKQNKSKNLTFFITSAVVGFSLLLIYALVVVVPKLSRLNSISQETLTAKVSKEQPVQFRVALLQIPALDVNEDKFSDELAEIFQIMESSPATNELNEFIQDLKQKFEDNEYLTTRSVKELAFDITEEDSENLKANLLEEITAEVSNLSTLNIQRNSISTVLDDLDEIESLVAAEPDFSIDSLLEDEDFLKNYQSYVDNYFILRQKVFDETILGFQNENFIKELTEFSNQIVADENKIREFELEKSELVRSLNGDGGSTLVNFFDRF